MEGLLPRRERFREPCSRVPAPRRLCTLATLLIALSVLCLEIRVVTRPSPVLESSEISRDALTDLHREGKFRLALSFNHHMVLQMSPDRALLWGWCDADDETKCTVQALLNGEFTRATVTQDQSEIEPFRTQYRWTVELPPMEAGGPHNIFIYGRQEILALTDVYFGDVFYCAGQSNMLMTVNQIHVDLEQEDDDYDYPLIRVMDIGRKESFQSTLDMIGEPALRWSKASNKSIRGNREEWTQFSALCWYYGKKYHQEKDIPVGLIEMAVNGSPLQTWIPPDLIKEEDRLGGEWRECCPNQDGVLWYGMVEPVMQQRARAVLWYQGESNFFGPEYYEREFPSFVERWRTSADQHLPFFTVEIAPSFYEHPYGEGFRAVQQRLAEQENDIYLTITVDLGDMQSPFGDLHPRFKIPIANRMVAQAMNVLWGEQVQSSGPTMSSVHVEDDPNTNSIAIVITYEPESVGTGLALQDFECPSQHWKLDEGTPITEICVAFEVQMTEQHSARIQLDPTIINHNQVRLSLPRDPAWSSENHVSRVSYASCGWPKAILFNQEGFPAPTFTYTTSSN